MKNYPAEFYATETKLIHKVGYTLALALMGVGALETLHSIPYILRGESSPIGATLGPATVSCLDLLLVATSWKPELSAEGFSMRLPKSLSSRA